MALGAMGLGGGSSASGLGTDGTSVIQSSMSNTLHPTAKVSTPGVNAQGIPTNPPNMQFRSVHLPAKGGGWDYAPPAQQEAPHSKSETMVEKVGRMMDEAAEGGAGGEERDGGEGGTNVDDISPEERSRQDQQPRNPKKRMMEVDVDDDRGGSRKDEL